MSPSSTTGGAATGQAGTTGSATGTAGAAPPASDDLVDLLGGLDQAVSSSLGTCRAQAQVAALEQQQHWICWLAAEDPGGWSG